MKSALLIFPHQLFAQHPGFEEAVDQVVLTEDPLFFSDKQYPLKFHKQKLVLHRASLKSYAAYLAEKKYNVIYKEFVDGNSKLNNIFDQLKKDDIKKVYLAEVVDFALQKRLKQQSERTDITLGWLQTPLFLNTRAENQKYRSSKNRWFMADFYKWQRQRLNILMDGENPVGGQWSFDEDNRKKLPTSKVADLPRLPEPMESSYITEAKRYVQQHFATHYGAVDTFIYPVDFVRARAWFDSFLQDRFANFGPYEDAIVADQNYLYHSVLTPVLNIGLLTPQEVLEKTLAYGKAHDVPIESLEGFIRQIIGWREFMRATYEDLGVTMRTTNAWQHKRSMPKSFYTANTTIEPIDNAIKRLLETAYCHHIERLMVLGGFMFLCEIDPDDIYQWFMEMFIDSYDWVMVPNVYAMSQNADGGHITTKPYFSGSNYICKMSHYKKGDWAEIWDGLYWSWILEHAEALQKNYRWAMMVRMAQKMNADKKQQHRKTAQAFLSR